MAGTLKIALSKPKKQGDCVTTEDLNHAMLSYYNCWKEWLKFISNNPEDVYLILLGREKNKWNTNTYSYTHTHTYSMIPVGEKSQHKMIKEKKNCESVFTKYRNSKDGSILFFIHFYVVCL